MQTTKVVFSGVNIDILIDSGIWLHGVTGQVWGAFQFTVLNASKHWVNQKYGEVRGKVVAAKNFRWDKCRSLADLLNDAFLIPSQWRNTHWGFSIHSATQVTLLVREVVVMVEFKELGLHGENLGNCCNSRPMVLSTSKLVEKFSMHVHNVLLYGSECCALGKEDKVRLERDDRAMLRWLVV